MPCMQVVLLKGRRKQMTRIGNGKEEGTKRNVLFFIVGPNNIAIESVY
jgi:hypothetical protein